MKRLVDGVTDSYRVTGAQQLPEQNNGSVQHGLTVTDGLTRRLKPRLALWRLYKTESQMIARHVLLKRYCDITKLHLGNTEF